MGYELHITRAGKDWEDEDNSPISAAEWLSVVEGDETLSVQWNDDDKYIATDWTPIDDPMQGRELHWHHGRISVKYPSMTLFVKLLELSKQLGGRVLGDDGELYEQPADYTLG